MSSDVVVVPKTKAPSITKGGDRALHAPHPIWAGGHFLFIHQREHGTEKVLARVEEYQDNGVHVDCVILDAFWWHPSDMFRFHPQLYPYPHRLVSALHRQGIKLILWMSAMVMTADATRMRQLRDGRFGLFEDMSAGPMIFNYHHHHYSPAMRGALVDFTNPAASAWFYESFKKLVTTYKIDGVRCGGVDSLIAKHRHIKGLAHGHMTPREYSDAYYRWFHDSGRLCVGFDFLVVARPVDTFENLVYHRFAPQDVTFAGWVGDHRFTFGGLRDTSMNLLHAAQACYVSIGCFVGGTLLDDVGKLPPERLAELETGAALLERGVGGSVALEEAKYRNLQRVESSPLAVSSSLFATDEEHAALLQRRQGELLLRWAELSSFMPFFATGAGHLHHPWTFNISRQYQKLVEVHRSLSLLHASNAAAALATNADMRLTPGRHHTADELRNMRRGCPIQSLSRRPVHYEFPVLGDWGLILNEALAVFPVLQSFGTELGGGINFAMSAWESLRSHEEKRRHEFSPDKTTGCAEWTHWWRPHHLLFNTCTAATPDVLQIAQQSTSRLGSPFAFQRVDALIPLVFYPPAAGRSKQDEEDTLILFRSVQLLGRAAATSIAFVTPHVPKPYLPAARANVVIGSVCASDLLLTRKISQFCVTLSLPSFADVDGVEEKLFGHAGGGDAADHSQLRLSLAAQVFLPRNVNVTALSCSCENGHIQLECPTKSLRSMASVSSALGLMADHAEIENGGWCATGIVSDGIDVGGEDGPFALLLVPVKLLAEDDTVTPSVRCSCK